MCMLMECVSVKFIGQIRVGTFLLCRLLCLHGRFSFLWCELICFVAGPSCLFIHLWNRCNLYPPLFDSQVICC